MILQRPKVSPYKEAIRKNLRELLGADPTAVNLKAKKLARRSIALENTGVSYRGSP